MFHFITKLIRKLTAQIGQPFYCVLYGRDKEVAIWIRPVRFLCSFLVGMLLAYLLWMLITINFNLSLLFANALPQEMVFMAFLMLNGLSFVLSRNVRSVTLLIFVALVGNAGRSYLRAIAFAFVISGPIDNLVTNAAEVARVFACSTVLTYNLTKTRFDLMAKPFTNTLQHMKSDIDEIQDNFKELQNILGDLKYGVEHADIQDDNFGYYKYRRSVNTTTNDNNATVNSELPKPSEVQQHFVRNMRNRCKHQLRSGHRVCEEVFRQGYRKCATNFPKWLSKVICWPYRIDIICQVNMFGNPDKVCDASKVVPADFGETYVKLLQTEHELYDNSSKIEITYQLQNITTSEQLRSAQQTSDHLIEDFDRRKRSFNTIMHIIEKFLCLFILIVIFSSFRYHWRYRCNVEFDNYYITDYFKHVDARRKSASKRSILPLRSYEKSKCVDVDEMCSRTVEESRIQIYHILQLSLEIVTAGLFLLLDRLVVNLLRIIHQRSLITYQQEGEHEVRFRINGTGLMARLLRTTMKNFNIHERVSTSLSNEECLPVAHALPRSFYIKLLLVYLIIILLIYQSTTFLRLRRVICGYFFYKREKQRILFLYNDMLRRRQSYLDTLRDNADGNLASRHMQGKTNICLIMRLSYPNQFGWLHKFSCAKRLCLICSVLEDNKFLICQSCGLPFCRECSRELKRVCIFCEQQLPEDVSNDNGDDTNRKKK